MTRTLLCASIIAAATSQVALADILAGKPDPAPAGHEAWISPLIVPSPPVSGNNGWEEAIAKAKDFVHDLTIPEKVNLTTGLGVLGSCIGNTGSIPRKGFNGFCLDDGAAGVRRAQHNSVFPSNLNLAATWDKDLMLKQGRGLGAEFKAKGVNVALAPDMNMVRAPAAGRNFEMPGADPYLSGVAATQLINGIQSQGVVATAKHFVAYEQEHARGGSLAQAYSSNVDDRTLHEIYLWPFDESIHIGVGAVMTSYNRVNQTFAAENSYLINGLLKGQLDFQGVAMTDWAAQTRGIDSALSGTDLNEPGFRIYGAGDATAPYNPLTGYPGTLDPATDKGSFFGANLIDAIKNGTLPEDRLTDMAVRIMAPYFKLGQDKGFPTTDLNRTTVATYVGEEHADPAAYHAQLIRDTGAASAVLLKNAESILPLKLKTLKKIGVFGNDSGPNTGGVNSCVDGACYNGTTAGGWGSATANFQYLVDPLQAINAYAKSKGSGQVSVQAVLDDSAHSEAATVAAASDVCIVCVGANSGEGYLTVEGNAGDRNDLELWHNGAKLVQTVASACKNTIVVIHSPGTVNIESFADNNNVKAILAAGQPGQESGNALVDVLFGAVNPSGRLPYTWGKDRKDYAADVHYYDVTNIDVSSPIDTIPQQDYTEKLLLDYRWFEAKNIKPRYAFGFGLSYTAFEYSKISVEKVGKALGSSSFLSLNADVGLDISLKARAESKHVHSKLRARQSTTNTTEIVRSIPPRKLAAIPKTIYEDAVNVHFTVRNSGKVAGHEVAQLYLSFPESAGEPPKVLRGFQKVYLEAGKSTPITLTLRKKDLSNWDTPSQSWVIPKGQFEVQIGASSDDIRLRKAFSM